MLNMSNRRLFRGGRGSFTKSAFNSIGPLQGTPKSLQLKSLKESMVLGDRFFLRLLNMFLSDRVLLRILTDRLFIKVIINKVHVRNLGPQVLSKVLSPFSGILFQSRTFEKVSFSGMEDELLR